MPVPLELSTERLRLVRLQADDLDHLVALDADFLGFRSALCGSGDRQGGIDGDGIAMAGKECIDLAGVLVLEHRTGGID